MAGILQKLFGSSNEKEVRRLLRIVDRVNELEPEISDLNTGEFPQKTAYFKDQLQKGASLDQILPEAFALAREASRRATGMRPFDVQVLGGLVLHQGRISEMKTGEGKTLVAVMPAYLNALTGKGVHIVTVNDYLARRDSEWMGPIFRLLGLETGLIVHDLDREQRQKAYSADIVYGTNNEFGFDYLRDHMVLDKAQQVQRELHYAVVDEVDSILIDEARTPLIISSPVESKSEYGRWKGEVERLLKKQQRQIGELLNSAQQHLEEGRREEAGELLFLARRGAPKNRRLLNMLREPGIEKLVERIKQRLQADKSDKALEEELYFSIDEITRAVSISQQGYRELVRGNTELEQVLGFKNAETAGVGSEEDQEAGEHLHYLHQLLKAYSLYERDVDYVVQEGKVIIVDEFTGRLMWGRRYSEGIHQAIEVKEGVEVQADSRTVASITFQNYFRMYEKLSGMTGTAATEEEEFRKIYGMDVVVIPTNEPMIRTDLADMIFKTERSKFKAAVAEIEQLYHSGQPVLVGTISVEKSEMLSRMLKRQGIPHQVLNAVNHDQEAQVIAQAGRKGAVTISTNMAGRGTDIILGGNPEFLARERLLKEYAGREDLSPEEIVRRKRRYDELMEKSRQLALREREEVLTLGGLHVLGTERHESRRIDNQLRGRSGRQGDPGSSQFFISLEDDLMRLFGGENIAAIMDRLGMEEDMPIEHPLVGGAIERAQRKVESRNFEIRRHLLEYDDVLNEQRRVIYEQRQQVLEGKNMRRPILDMVEEVITCRLQTYFMERQFLEPSEAEALVREGERFFLPRGKFDPSLLVDQDLKTAKQLFMEEALAYYGRREEEIGPENMRDLERVVLLRTVDSHWMDHIDAMHELRQSIGLRAYGQQDPLVEYRHEGFDMFEAMIGSIQEEVTRLIYLLRIAARPRRRDVVATATASHQRVAPVGGGAGKEGVPSPAVQKTEPVTVAKVGRNEPCPCGSGKKYKRCCGK